MRDRRGMALLAALWFVVAIATVGLALEFEAAEHRRLGLAAADRRAAEAAATGGLAIALARLDRALRQVPRTTASAASHLRASDPWLDADSLFPKPLRVGNAVVWVHAVDLQSKVNINAIRGSRLRSFLGFVLQDYGAADALAEAIDDWRDRDDLRQPRGAERSEYLARRQLDLPTNRAGFRDFGELRSVQGMTPAAFARLRPYLRLQGQGWEGINVNTAPPAVLRSVGLTEDAITRIMAIRSQHQRVTSLAELGDTTLINSQLRKNLENGGNGGGLTFSTTQLELTVTAVLPSPARPLQRVWVVEQDGGNTASVRWTDYAY